MDELIRTECTGGPREFANKLKISRSYFYFLLEMLKDYEAKIAYCREAKTYYYLQDFDFDKSVR